VIREVEFYHGAALARLFRGGKRGVSVRALGRSSYVLDAQIGLYLKYSSNRMSPWPFSFTDEHQHEIAKLASECSAVFVALICGSDGVACLSHAELRRVLDDDVRAAEWVKAARQKREKYAITGSDGRKCFKVGGNEFPGKILSELSADET
jgi:hypothetical protein